jgi:hypothetical protein
MPAPDKDLFALLTKYSFIAKMKLLPIEWGPPGPQYPDAFNPEELVVAPNKPLNLFREVSLNKYHVEAAKTIGEQFEKYIEGICGAISQGIDLWMKLVGVFGVLINGPVGTVFPGCFISPPLGPLVLADAPKNTFQETKYSNAISNALGQNWQAWQSGLMGVLMYPPTFAVFPGPMHPPTPNIPLPLITLGSAGESLLSPGMLKSTMEQFLADPKALHAADLFDSIANAFYIVFTIFKASTLVQNVLGTGAVPTFAPPVVPVGPVVMGLGTGPPGAVLS